MVGLMVLMDSLSSTFAHSTPSADKQEHFAIRPEVFSSWTLLESLVKICLIYYLHLLRGVDLG